MIPKLDIIIVNWNSGTLLSECIGSINKAIQHSFILNKVVVIDNASSDNSLENLDTTNLPLTIIRNTQNHGFAKACNQGAKNSKVDFLLFLNPDTHLFQNSLSEPISFMVKEENQGIGIIGVQIINEKNKISRTCSRFPNLYRMIYMSLGLDRIFPKVFPGHFVNEWDHADSRIVDQVMGSFFLVRKTLFEKLNGFDERFFVYYEDLDFSLRLKENGFQSYYLSTAKIYHKGGGTSEKVKAVRLSYILRSKLLFCKKHFSALSFLLILLVTIIIEPFARIIGALMKGSYQEITEILKGYKKLIFK